MHSNDEDVSDHLLKAGSDQPDVEDFYDDNYDRDINIDSREKEICAKKEWRRSMGIVALSFIPLLLCFVLGSKNGSKSHISSPMPITTVGSAGKHRLPYSTTEEVWTTEQLYKYEYENTPKQDPQVTYYPRIKDQAAAEIANTEEEVRFITNSADIAEAAGPQYVLLVRVLSSTRNASRLTETKSRWSSILTKFQLPAFVRAEIEFITPKSDKDRVPMKILFALPDETTFADWIFVVPDFTYVNLSRLVRRLIADVDPTTNARKGLLVPHHSISVPLLEAGILFTRRGLAEVWDSTPTKSCWNEETVSYWCACSQKAGTSLSWQPMAGLNPINVRDMMRQSLEGGLFESTNHLYDSVGGPLRGTARLPITYANMTLDMFSDQLAVDTHQGRVPKVLHHIWSGPLENMEKETKKGAKQCRKMHEEQGWEYILWTDEKLKALPGLPSVPYMEGNLKFIRHYVDTVRYYLLHQFGGVYVDMDAFCMRTFDPLLKYSEEKGTDLLMNYESQRHRGRQIANGIMVAAPASPVLSAFILHLGYRLKKHHDVFTTESSYRRAGRITGPWVVTEVRDQWESWVKDHLYVLSSSAFIPLYREGDEGNLEGKDVFSLARKQGSYTVQIYHSGALKSLLKSEYSAGPPKSAPAIMAAPEEDVEDEESSADTNGQQSVLMVVAHPDDEVIWGGDYLLSEGDHVHVVTTSTINKETPKRREEFTNVEHRLGFQGEFLNGTDSHRTKTIEDHIQRHIQDLVCNRKWSKIITHGPEGEYGHPQHQQVFDAVLKAVRICCHSFDDLFVFEPHPTPDYSFSEEKREVTNLYISQRKVIEKFDNWKEQIVKLADYNYERASADCIEGALSKSKTRKCRLHEMMNVDELSTKGIPAIFAAGEFEGRGIGC